MKSVINENDVKAFVLGGAVLGGGGGGSISKGIEMGLLAVKIAPIEIFEPQEIELDETVVTVSAVGVQSKGELKPWHYVRAVELLQSIGLDIGALISSENGAFSTVNGWIQSAILGIPILDAPCDGRAHPTGLMGSMNLHRIKDYISIQAAVGGGERSNSLEIVVSGKLEKVSKIIRNFSVEAGGIVAVARNPVNVRYVLENGAPKALEMAYNIGEAMLTSGKGVNAIKAATNVLNGNIVCRGKVISKKLRRLKGFDVGKIVIKTKEDEFEIDFVNEYMTIEKNGERIATFPDLINIFSLGSGLPLNSSEIRKGQNIVVTSVSKDNIVLGSGLKYAEAYLAIEEILGKKIWSGMIR